LKTHFREEPKKVSFEKIIRQATAFTHVRRIEIVRALADSNQTFDGLHTLTGISKPSLTRHLGKLESRRFVSIHSGRYCLKTPGNLLGRCLMKIACLQRCGSLSSGSAYVSKVISGGQTGADRAALDAAMACGVPHGGWCPKGRLAEDGAIPAKYGLRERESGSYSERTEANILDSDATLIFSHGPLTGGSRLTQELAEQYERPCLHCDLTAGGRPAVTINTWVKSFSGPIVLNVAGPRASGDPDIYMDVYQAMTKSLNSR